MLRGAGQTRAQPHLRKVPSIESESGAKLPSRRSGKSFSYTERSVTFAENLHGLRLRAPLDPLWQCSCSFVSRTSERPGAGFDARYSMYFAHVRNWLLIPASIRRRRSRQPPQTKERVSTHHLLLRRHQPRSSFVADSESGMLPTTGSSWTKHARSRSADSRHRSTRAVQWERCSCDRSPLSG